MSEKKKPPDQKKKVPHSFTWKVPACHWLCCIRCGLILLNNEATRKAASKPCE